MPTTRTHLVTEAEFLALAESVQKVELIDGEVIVAPAPSSRHQEILGRLIYALRVWAASAAKPVTIAPWIRGPNGLSPRPGSCHEGPEVTGRGELGP